jgi:hypothetical protein
MNAMLHTIVLYSVLIILFFIDICCNALYAQPYLFLLLAAYLVIVCYARTQTPLLAAGFLLMIQSAIYYDIWYLPCIYIIPTWLISSQLHGLLYRVSWYAPLLIFICLGIHLHIIEWAVSGVAPDIAYTSSTIAANMAMSWFLSLTYIMQGRLDNRL